MTGKRSRAFTSALLVLSMTTTLLLGAPPSPAAAAEAPPTFVLKWGSSGTGPGQFVTNGGIGVTTDASGNVYVADNSRIQKFDPSGTLLLSWGSFGTADGQFRAPFGVATDASGNVYVADHFNNRIQKFGSAGNLLAIWTGLNEPLGVAADAFGNVYVANTNSNTIRKHRASDGALLQQWGGFNGPVGVATDSGGNVYVADRGNNQIKKFASGILVGSWGSGGSGDGQFNGPNLIATDSSGNVYVADTDNHRIQKFSSSGTFLTKWGSLGTGDGQFNRPLGVAVDGSGNVYVADQNNNRIQKFSVVPAPAPASVGLWHLDAATANVTPDDSGGGHHGTLVNGPTFVAGRVGSALSFNGSNQYVDLGKPAILNGSSAFTLEAWIRPSAGFSTDYRAVIYAYSPTEPGGRWALNTVRADHNGGVPALRCEKGITTGDVIADTTAAITADTWTHVACTYDGSRLRIYLNGIEAPTVAGSTPSGAVLDANQLVSIGRWPGNGTTTHGQYFLGLIDEVQVFRVARSAAEIAQDATPPAATPAPTWQQLAPGGGPPAARGRHVAVFDPSSNGLLVYGGLPPGSGAPFGDMWRLSNANGTGGTPQWTQVIAAGPQPAARSGMRAVYDPANDRMVMFGGTNSTHAASLTMFNDVWVLSGALRGTPTWAQLTTGGIVMPRLVLPAVAYDTTRNKLIVSAGNTFEGSCSALTNATYALSNANGLGGAAVWTQLAPAGTVPAPRWHTPGAYDPNTDSFMFFGGTAACSGLPAETWVLKNVSSAPQWVKLAPASSPSARSGHISAYDVSRNELVIFGGFGPLNETWTLSGANAVGTPTWTQQSPEAPLPPGRGNLGAGHDQANSRIMIFAGEDATGVLNDTWVLKFGVSTPPEISIDDAIVDEGDIGTTQATFNVTLSAPSSEQVMVSYATSDETANAGVDYVGASGVLSFAPGETQKTITVVVNGDTLAEANESFRVDLSGPVGATLAVTYGRGTITNDDPVPTVSIAGTSLPEGNGGTSQATFSVTLSNPSSSTITVSFATQDGTATVAGSDYQAQSGTLSFAPGETSKTFTVAVNGDTLYEPTETFNAKLISASGATVGIGTGTMTIVNDDPPSAPLVTLADVNFANRAAVPLSVSGEAGAAIAFSVTDGTNTVSGSGSVGASGTFSTTVNLTGLTDGTVTASATLTDALGNVSAAGTDSSLKDTVAPSAPSVNLANVNAANKTAAALAIAGEVGAAIAYAISDGANTVSGSGSVGAGGAFSTTVNLTALADGTVTASATLTDALGNTSSPGTDGSLKDTVAPAQPLVTLADVNGANKTAVPLTITGEPGSSAAYAISDGTSTVNGSGTLGAGGTFSTTVDLTGLADGTVNASATLTDALGNTSAAGTDGSLKDTVAPAQPVVTLADVTAANKAGVPLSVTGEPGTTFTFSVTDGTTTVSGQLPLGASGTFSDTVNLSALADGPISASITLTDAFGNTSVPGMDPSTKDATLPAVTIVSPTANDALPNSFADVSVSATDASGVTQVWVNGVAAQFDALTSRWVARVSFTRPVVAPDAAVTFTAFARDGFGNIGNAASVAVDGDGIDAIVDTDPTHYSDAFSDGQTSGSVAQRGGWYVSIQAGLKATITGSGTQAHISTCPSGGSETLVLDVATESARFFCSGSTTYATVVTAKPSLRLCGVINGWYKCGTWKSGTVWAGSPIGAVDNEEPVLVSVLDPFGEEVATFELDSGESVDVSPTDDRTARFEVLAGTVAISMSGVTRTLGAGESATFVVDRTPPVVTATATMSDGRPYVAGTWSAQAVTVAWSAVDPDSGVTQTNGCATVVVAGDTAGTTLTCTAVNGNGLTTTVSLPVRVDRTPAEAVVRLSPASRTIEVSGRDATSGIATVALISRAPSPGGGPLAGQRAERLTYEITDNAGNVTTVTEDVRLAGDQAKASLVSIRYLGGGDRTFDDRLSFEWSLDAGALRNLNQRIEAAGEDVSAKFDAKNDRTTITTKGGAAITRIGLALLQLVTDAGRLRIEQP